MFIKGTSLANNKFNEKDFTEIASSYKLKNIKLNFLYESFNNLDLSFDNPYPVKYYNNNIINKL